jgi:hypothetical protein
MFFNTNNHIPISYTQVAPYNTRNNEMVQLSKIIKSVHKGTPLEGFWLVTNKIECLSYKQALNRCNESNVAPGLMQLQHSAQQERFFFLKKISVPKLRLNFKLLFCRILWTILHIFGGKNVMQWLQSTHSSERSKVQFFF